MAESSRMVDGIEIVDYRELRLQRLLGRGTFGEVHVAHYPNPQVTNPVVIKRIHEPVDENARKLFMKEAKLLSGLHHENIVRMYGICMGPLVIIMEYVFFDFKPFLNRKHEINTVDKFLHEVSKLPKSEHRFDHMIPAIASDVTEGLSYLHNLQIAHRDLKPMNVLISNQHYCDLEDSQAIKRFILARPVICKLADFGESRSQLLQTNKVDDPGTRSTWRGTIPFMAPEILLPEGLAPGKKLSLEDLKKVDIWALGLVFYCLMNPSVSYPYERDGVNIQDLMMLQRQKKRPSADPGYQSKQSTVWSRVYNAFQACTRYNSSERPNASHVLGVLHPHRPTNRYTVDGTPPKQKPPERSHLLGNPARTPAVQWYTGEQGEGALKHVFDELTQIADSDVNMSRNTVTQDVSMSFIHHGQEWEVKFPSNFPRGNACVTCDGEERDMIGGDTVEIAVRRIISLIIVSIRMDQPPLHRHGNPGDKAVIQWYHGDEGEADLKYVHGELTRIANGEVKISRKTDTKNVTLSFVSQGQSWQVKFPSNFPKSKASLVKDGEEQEKIGGANMKVAVRAIISRISPTKEPSGDMFRSPACEAQAQWYDGDEGEAALKYVFEELTKIADRDVNMRRKTDTQDITLSFERRGQIWQVKFPSNFPNSFASLISNGEECRKVGGDNVESATSAIANHIAGQRNAGINIPTVQWYVSEQGEADLKYVFDQLRQIADDDDVSMSRTTDTQDVTLSFERHGQQWQVTFPSNFPNSNASLTFNGDVYANVGGNTLQTAVSAIKYRITSVDQPGAKTVHWKPCAIS